MTEATAIAGLAPVRDALRPFSEERLVRRAAAGDERAFATIYRRYNRDLYRYLLAILGNREDAADALQATMVKTMRALPGERREIALKPWLYRIAHNEAIDLVRRRRVGVDPLEPEVAAADPQPHEQVEQRTRLRRLLEDLDDLPGRQRGVLVMRELSGLGFEEIAEALDTSTGVVRQTLYEARRSLRQMEAGRELRCDVVTRALSDADGRVGRRRDLRAHLRGCPGCRRFRQEMKERHADLGALAPLPAVAGAAILKGILGGSAPGAGSATLGGGIGGTIGAAAVVKSAATVAAVAVLGTAVADRGGLIDLGLSRGGNPVGTTHHHAAPAPANPHHGSAPASRGSRSAPPVAGDPSRGAGGEGPRTATGEKRPDHPAHPSSVPAAVGGHGKPASNSMPAAATQGQETAGAKKPPAAATPGGSGNPPDPPAKPESQPQPPPVPTSPPAPAAPGGSQQVQQAQGATPPPSQQHAGGASVGSQPGPPSGGPPGKLPK